MKIWRRRVLVLAIAVGIFLLDHPRHRFADIHQYFGVSLPLALSEFTKPGTGERVLPTSVQAMLELLRSHGVKAYRVSSKIAADPLISQRIVESAWPIRPDRSSSWYLAFAAETLPVTCLSYGHRQDVVLARCP
jgi:hypothetical protein